MKKILIIISIIFLIGYFSKSYLVSSLSINQKKIINKYVLPYKYISQLEKYISQREKILRDRDESISYHLKVLNELSLNSELNFKESLNDIEIEKLKNIKLSNDMTMNKYKIKNGFYSGIFHIFPGSGYIDFHQNNLLILSSRGILGYTKNIEKNLYLKQIENNINEFIDLKQFQKPLEKFRDPKRFSLKNLFVHKDKIFISFTEEIKTDCWNTSVIFADMNYEKITFKKLFSNKECIHSQNNIDKEFNAHQSGGKIVDFDDEHILLSTGEYRERYLAQNEQSLNGKIIKINFNNYNFEIVSMGHRNPQGLYFDKKNNFILETEHGPMGGDEINLISIDKINKDKILNYGWPIVSAGEHYGGKSETNKIKYKKYPLYKSHSEYDFIEPLKSFVPSIAISQVNKIGENKYVIGSMGKPENGGKSIYFFELNSEKKIINLERVEVFERVRDLRYNKNKLYLFLEDTPSIGIISLD